jgi:hypothetical protein
MIDLAAIPGRADAALRVPEISRSRVFDLAEKIERAASAHHGGSFALMAALPPLLTIVPA